MSKEKDILNNLKKQQKPQVPEGFFESFADELMAKIAEEESGLSRLKKSDKPKVPVEFFEGFANKIEQNTNAQESKGTVISLKVVGFVSAVAACLLIGFFLLPTDNSTHTVADTEVNTTTDSTQEILSNEALLAMMDEDDIVNFLIENEDIELETSTTSKSESYLDGEDVFYYLEEDLEQLYIEDL